MSTIPKPYLTTLTPLRGIAALLVVIFHSNLMLLPFLPPGYTDLIWRGPLWVDFFFILSGFIMSYVYGKNFETSISRKGYWKYIGARFARVYPLHLFTLIWAAIGAAFIHFYASGFHPFFAAIFDLKAIPASLLLAQSLHLFITAPLNTPSWSLSTEWWVYMIFPFLVPFFSRLKIPGVTVVLIFVAAFYVFLKYVIGPISGPFGGGSPNLDLLTDFGLLRCLAGFLLGMVFCRIYDQRYGYAFLKRSYAFILFFLGVLIAMHFGAVDFLILAIFPFIILTAAHNTSSIKKILDTRPLQLLGDWSFSIYMVHVPIMYFFFIYKVRMNPDQFADFPKGDIIPDYALGAVVCVTLVLSTLIVAALTYRFIEVPARHWLNRKLAPKPKLELDVK